jgi:hypothetical protein
MVLNGAGGWENRKNACNEREDEEGSGREGKEGREAVGEKPHRRYTALPSNHRHRTQANLLRGQTLPRKPAEVPAPDIGYEQEAHHQVCDFEEAPNYKWKNPGAVYRLCTLKADLRNIPTKKFKRITNSKGQQFYRVDYKLIMEVEDEVCSI